MLLPFKGKTVRLPGEQRNCNCYNKCSPHSCNEQDLNPGSVEVQDEKT